MECYVVSEDGRSEIVNVFYEKGTKEEAEKTCLSSYKQVVNSAYKKSS